VVREYDGVRVKQFGEWCLFMCVQRSQVKSTEQGKRVSQHKEGAIEDFKGKERLASFSEISSLNESSGLKELTKQEQYTNTNASVQRERWH
jgi:hypothetical protein